MQHGLSSCNSVQFIGTLMTSAIPLGVLPTDGQIWQNSVSIHGFKACRVAKPQ